MEKFYTKKVAQKSDIIFERLLIGDVKTKEEIKFMIEKHKDSFKSSFFL